MRKRFLFSTLLAGFVTVALALPGIIQSKALAELPFQEVYDAGLIKYVGSSLVKPTSKTVLGDIITYHYKPSTTGRGPICMRGAEFFVEARDGKWGNKNLLIFLEGGGVCLDEICQATADPMLSLKLMSTSALIGMGGVLNEVNIFNPMRNYNVVHIPYCDGSVFMGDVDRILSDGDDSNGMQDMAYQRGLQNLTAALEVAKLRYPNPSRVVLAGTSGGSYGIVAATALARYYYPNKEIVVVADSGAPILRDEDKDFVNRVLTQINAIQYVPSVSCPDCIANGHVTKIIDWALQRDNNFRIAYMSHADDAVIGDYFMASPPPIFRNAAIREAGILAAAWPKRVHRFITPGTAHTYLLDVGIIPDFMQEIAIALFGDFILTGSSPSMENMTMGDLYEKGINQKGRWTNGYQWLTKFLNNSTYDPCIDVVNE